MVKQTNVEKLHEVVNGDAYAQIAADMASLAPSFAGDARIFAHVKALSEIMPRLRSSVSLPVPYVPLAAPEA